jgi:internalin A
MEQVWDRVEKMLVRFAPGVLQNLRPPATLAQIRVAEEATGLSLPQEIRDIYLRHDGSRTWDGVSSGKTHDSLFVWPCEWCSLEESTSIWQSQLQFTEELQTTESELFPPWEPFWDELAIRPEFWNRARFPVGSSNTSLKTYIDFAPAAQGQEGQLISDDSTMEPSLRAPSLNAYLIALTDAVEAGEVIHDQKYGWIGAKAGYRIHSLFPTLQLSNYGSLSVT